MIKKYTGESALLFTTVIWGGTFAIIKTALGSISPMMFISLRFSVAAILLLPFVFRKMKKLDLRSVKEGIILGLLYFGGFASQTIGLNYTTATKSAFITGTFVIFTPIFQIIIEKRPPSKGNILGIILVAGGLIFLSSKGTNLAAIIHELGTNFNVGDYLTLICAVFYSLYIVYLDIVSKKIDYMPLTFMQIAVTAAGGITGAIIFQATGLEISRFILNKDVIFAVIYTSILATILTTTMQTKFQKYTTPAKAGIIFSFEPIFASIVAFFLLSEKISNFGLFGCIFIFFGLMISEVMD
ncbi:MAG: DMT family transporter [Ignavibacteriaceae bacterium]|nr:DMT family transporter [Ignavibacteriaceae bacterium]